MTPKVKPDTNAEEILAYEGIQYRSMAPSVMEVDPLDYLREDRQCQRKNRRTSAGREETDERQKTRRVYGYVRHAGRTGGGGSAADGAVWQDWPSGQRKAGEGRGCRCGGISARRLP